MEEEVARVDRDEVGEDKEGDGRGGRHCYYVCGFVCHTFSNARMPHRQHRVVMPRELSCNSSALRTGPI